MMRQGPFFVAGAQKLPPLLHCSAQVFANLRKGHQSNDHLATSFRISVFAVDVRAQSSLLLSDDDASLDAQSAGDFKSNPLAI